MFHPKTVDMGGNAFDTNTATLREYFGMDVEDATVAYYAKQGVFHPTNSHDLRIQLETALEMLELLTGPDRTRSRHTASITLLIQKCGEGIRHDSTTGSSET